MKVFFRLLFACSIATASFALDISNLANCVEESKKNLALPETDNDVVPFEYNSLMASLAKPEVRAAFPAIYQQGMLDPFTSFLQGMGKANFDSIFFGGGGKNPQAPFFQQIIPDVVDAILQIGNKFAPLATNAFEELVSDLYEGFLSEESRRSKETGRAIKPPDRGVLPPLVKWSKPENGPYTWPVDATRLLGLKAAVVSLPPNHRLGGILAWTTLPHETGGHDFLHADSGLLDELRNTIYSTVLSRFPGYSFLANYWAQCTDETVSDICGLLNGGPTIGIGLVGYFRALVGSLRNYGAMPPADTHPIDILRGYIAARVIEQMPFAGAKEWANVIRQELQKDLQMIFLVDTRTNARYPIPQQIAIQSAEAVADAACSTKLASLEGNALKDIQNWSDQDEKIAQELGALIREGSPFPANYKNSGYYAAHVVAGAVTEALKGGANIQKIFHAMVRYLDVMHRNNNTWRQVKMPHRVAETDLPGLFTPRKTMHRIEGMEEKDAA